jgi:hypothetical protein
MRRMMGAGLSGALAGVVAIAATLAMAAATADRSFAQADAKPKTTWSGRAARKPAQPAAKPAAPAAQPQAAATPAPAQPPTQQPTTPTPMATTPATPGPVARGPEQEYRECLALWDAKTHMTRSEWAATCRRIQTRLNDITAQTQVNQGRRRVR